MATILVVDDLVINRRLLVAVLSQEGHRILEAADGSAGLTMARAERPDLVITDVLMPVVDGYEFVRQLRLDPLTGAIPVLFYTAPYGEREARAFARGSGVPYVLTKPPEPAEVLNIVGRVLAGTIEFESVDAGETLEGAVDREQLRLLGDRLSATSEDLRLANARLRALINIGLDFASQRDTDRRLRRLCAAAHDLFGATYVTVGLLSPPDRRLRRVVASGAEAASWIAEGDALSGIFATVVDERRSARGTIAPDEPSDRPFPPGHPDVQTFLIAPLASPAHVHGWLCLIGNDGVSFDDETEQQVLALAGHVGRIYELEQEISDRLIAETALRHSEELNRNLLEHLPHRIVIKDRQSVVQFCNANYARDLGRSVADMIGKDAFHFHAPEIAAARNAHDDEVMASGVIKNMEESYEVDGHKRWVHTIKIPYRDAQGEVTGVLAVFEDITEQRAREQQYQQAEKMEAVGRLAGGVAHDFNNLLTAILGYCELIFEDLAPHDRHRGDIMEIRTAGLRAAGLTRQLLAFSRKEIIKPTILDLNIVITEMRAMLGRLIREDVEIVVRVAPAVALVEADRGQVEQIVLNLALNARDAMPAGGTLTIETAHIELDDHYVATHPSVVAGAHVALIVTDTGAGMAPDVRARIFEPFFTTKGVGQGTGLGLASVHGILARSGGSVDVFSEMGKGTAFKVYFPRAEAAVPFPVVSAQAAPRLAGTETILVAEDAEALRSLTSRVLKRQGYSVLVAASADEAIRPSGSTHRSTCSSPTW